MRSTTAEAPVLSSEQQRHLHGIWMNITLALVVTGHGRDLRLALDGVCSTAREQPSVHNYIAGLLTDGLAGGAGSRFATSSFEPASRPPSINQQSFYPGWDTDLSADRPSTTDNDARSVDISDSEEDMDDLFDVSGDLIAESADLSRHRYDRVLKIPSDVLDLEDPFPALNISSIAHAPAPDDAGSLPASTGPVSTFPRVWQSAGWNWAGGDRGTTATVDPRTAGYAWSEVQERPEEYFCPAKREVRFDCCRDG
jgi:hypothetical protein